MKKIILCADDYGQNQAISQGILELIRKKRLSATSCLVTFPDWSKWAAELTPYAHTLDIGLHLNLTEGEPLSSLLQQLRGFWNLPTLMIQSYLRLLDKAAIWQELNQQLDAFVSALGRPPDFIDGHQHAHQLPIIRDLVLALYRERLTVFPCYVRCVYQPLRFSGRDTMKQRMIQCMGASSFKRLLQQQHIVHNSSFEGIYRFNEASEYSMRFPLFLDRVGENGLIMCHPAMKSAGGHHDVIAIARGHEFDYFNSDQFLNDCKQAGVRLGRMREHGFFRLSEQCDG